MSTSDQSREPKWPEEGGPDDAVDLAAQGPERGLLLTLRDFLVDENGVEAWVVEPEGSDAVPYLVVDRLARTTEIVVERRPLESSDEGTGLRLCYVWRGGDVIGCTDEKQAASDLVAAVMGVRRLL